MTSGTLPTAPPLGMLDEVLSGRLGVAAVRDVVLHPWQHGAGGSPAEIPAGPLTDGAVGLTLLRSKFKPGRKLSAYYRRGPGDGAAAEYLAVSWHSGAADGDTGAVTVQAFPDDPGDAAARPALRPALPRVTGHRPRSPTAGGRGPARGRAAPGDSGPLPARAAPRAQRQCVSGDTGSSQRLLRQDRQGHLRRTGDRGGPRLGPLLARRCPHATVVEPWASRGDSAALWRMAPGAPSHASWQFARVRRRHTWPWWAGQRGCCTTRRAPP